MGYEVETRANIVVAAHVEDNANRGCLVDRLERDRIPNGSGGNERLFERANGNAFRDRKPGRMQVAICPVFVTCNLDTDGGGRRRHLAAYALAKAPVAEFHDTAARIDVRSGNPALSRGGRKCSA